MQEIAVAPTGKLDLKVSSRRLEYLAVVDGVLELAFSHIKNRYTKNSERVSWGNLIAKLVTAGSVTLRDADLDEILERLDTLEENAESKKIGAKKYMQSN